MISGVVTRNPEINSDLIPSFSNAASICGPPPWTTIGCLPPCCNETTSLANALWRLASVIAWPPYLITIMMNTPNSHEHTSCLNHLSKQLLQIFHFLNQLKSKHLFRSYLQVRDQPKARCSWRSSLH